MQPMTELLTASVQQIWHDECERMTKELFERVTARLLVLEKELQVKYQHDPATRDTMLYVVLPGVDEVTK
jgi:hypothetical protein